VTCERIDVAFACSKMPVYQCLARSLHFDAPCSERRCKKRHVAELESENGVDGDAYGDKSERKDPVRVMQYNEQAKQTDATHIHVLIHAILA
jgi:hypothetical protein